MINMAENVEIEEIDKRMLFELERNARIPDVTLAKIVKKSITSAGKPGANAPISRSR